MKENHDFSTSKYSLWNVSYIYNEDGIPVHRDDFLKNRPEEFRPQRKEISNDNKEIDFSLSLN